MDFIFDGLAEAVRLVLGGDAEVFHAVWVTLYVTVASTMLAAAAALPYGVWLGVGRPRFRGLQVFCVRYAMFVPTVIIGLFVYAVLSRRGPLGGLDLLYTREAVIFGEFLLAFPIVGTFAHATASSPRGHLVYETARTLGAGPFRAMLTVISESRTVLLGAWLVAVARCYAELGIVSTVGGNLRLETRTLSSTIQLELSRGNFARGIACGVFLLTVAMTFAITGNALARGRNR